MSTDPIAVRTHRAAVQMWQSLGSRGPRPAEADFAHLADHPDPEAASPRQYGPSSVVEALAAMQAANGTRPTRPSP